MKEFESLFYAALVCGFSTGVHATELDTLVQCTQALRFGNYIHSVPKTKSHFDICLRSTKGSNVLYSRFEQTKNYFPIRYELKFADESSVTMKLALVDAKNCKNPSKLILRRVGQGNYSGRACVHLKSPKGTAIELTAANRIPLGLSAKFISGFRFQIHSSYCADLTRNVCEPTEYLNVGFRFDEGSLD